MLNELQPDLCELIELVRQAENYDATMAASALAGTPIAVGADAVANNASGFTEYLQLGMPHFGTVAAHQCDSFSRCHVCQSDYFQISQQHQRFDQ